MIVVDTNVLAYLLLPGPFTRAAEQLYEIDPDWCVPLLWRSEFRSVLAGFLRRSSVDLPTATRIAERAAGVVRGREYVVGSAEVLEAISSSTCSAYDCEFVVLARELGFSLITTDSRILREFPGVARSLRAVVAEGA
ncbi:MAG: type II toxin-antitoxin system VapC family toxin [Deltaproteobacteria bacterium]|nr:type II toxin-antitoxin system VapC family toxin [Deltaproteobacteria bacterium]